MCNLRAIYNKMCFMKTQIPKMIFYAIFLGVWLPQYVKLSKGLYNNFVDTNIVFNVDTLFLNWNTSFPAVTICELYNGEKIWDLSDKYFGVEHDMRLNDVVGEITYYSGTCSICEICESKNFTCPTNFTEIIDKFRTSCSSLITHCKYQNMAFDCCARFYPIHTEYGICFTFNSNQASKKHDVEYNSNREFGVGFLSFEITADIQLYIHSPIEIPHQSVKDMITETIFLGTKREIILNAVDVFNHPNLYQISYDERRCRFPSELTDLGKQLKLYKFYSFSTCVAECTFAAHIKLCNCSSHFLVKNESPFKMCNYGGLMCLANYYNDIMNELEKCDCLNSCDEPEYNIIYNSAEETNSGVTEIKVSQAQQPTLRYVRRVNKTNLDLLISIGGLAGLFFNISLARIVEYAFLVLFYKWKSLVQK